MSERNTSTSAAPPTPETASVLAQERRARKDERRQGRGPRIVLLMIVAMLTLCFFVAPACVENTQRQKVTADLVRLFSLSAEYDCCYSLKSEACADYDAEYLAVVERAEAYAQGSTVLFAWGRLNGLNASMAEDAAAWAKQIRDGYTQCQTHRK